MSKTTVYVTGVDALKRGLKERAKLADLKKAVLLNGAEMTEQAKRNSPVKTGDLKGSVSQSTTDGGLTSKTAPHMDYGAYQELGTRYFTGRFYLKRAFNVQGPLFIRDIRRLVK